MSREERRNPAAMTQDLPAGTRGPHWRELLEARWQTRMREVTELSLAYHVAAAAAPDGTGDGTDQPEPGMTAWRKYLFIAIARSATSEGDYLRLPDERTVILSAKIPI
jgi:hypothetical protein